MLYPHYKPKKDIEKLKTSTSSGKDHTSILIMLEILCGILFRVPVRRTSPALPNIVMGWYGQVWAMVAE